MVIVELKNGAVGTILGTTTFTGNINYVEIHGSHGSMVVSNNKAEWLFGDWNDIYKPAL